MTSSEQSQDAPAAGALPLPPQAMRYMGETDERFLRVGDETVADLRDVVGLRNDERVLDVGCGYGRLAHALMRDDSFHGEFLGLDILSRPIEWCEAELAPRSGGRARFRLIDVANARYFPEGGTPGHRAKLRVEPGSFDVAALISVFTHFDPQTVERYFGEISKALAPDGRVLISVFLLNESWHRFEDEGLCPIPMPHEMTSFCRYKDDADPLAAIGYEPGWLDERAAEAGLEPTGPPRLGSWCGRSDGIGHLDVVSYRPAGSWA